MRTKLMTAAFLLGGLLVGLALGIFILHNIQKASAASTRNLPPAVGSPVRDFTLPTLDGEDLKLSDLKGKPVMINFWATWCGPCREEFPLIEQYARTYSDRLVVIGVNSQEEQSVVEPYIKEMGITFPIVLDKAGLVSDMYFTRSFPSTFFVGPDGVLKAQHLGLLNERVLVRYLTTIGIQP